MYDIFPKDKDKANVLWVIFCFAVIFALFYCTTTKTAKAVGSLFLSSKNYRFPIAEDYGAKDVTPRN